MLTEDQIARKYGQCIKSVEMIHHLVNNVDNIVHLVGQEQVDFAVARNVEYLEGMRQADFWTDEDMAPIDAAIAAGNTALTE